MLYITERQWQKYQRRAQHERSQMFYVLAIAILKSVKNILPNERSARADDPAMLANPNPASSLRGQDEMAGPDQALNGC